MEEVGSRLRKNDDDKDYMKQITATLARLEETIGQLRRRL